MTTKICGLRGAFLVRRSFLRVHTFQARERLARRRPYRGHDFLSTYAAYHLVLRGFLLVPPSSAGSRSSLPSDVTPPSGQLMGFPTRVRRPSRPCASRLNRAKKKPPRLARVLDGSSENGSFQLNRKRIARVLPSCIAEPGRHGKCRARTAQPPWSAPVYFALPAWYTVRRQTYKAITGRTLCRQLPGMGGKVWTRTRVTGNVGWGFF